MIDRSMTEQERANIKKTRKRQAVRGAEQQTHKATHDEIAARLRRSRKEAKADNAETMILEGIVQFFSRRGLEFPSMASLRAAPGYAAFAGVAPDLARYLQAASSDRREQAALLQMGFDILYRALIDTGEAVSSYGLMPAVGRIPSLINKEFPGYVESFGPQSLVVFAKWYQQRTRVS
jgi:hypothetical protein